MPAMVLRNFNISQFQEDLLNWYDENKRDLPWRKDQDPYKVWVSEIMLQQTKVDTVIPYFHRFMEQFPNVYELASAEEEKVLKAWEGLGYYSRARNLHTAVKEVVSEYDGKVPDNPKQLGKLKGIGPYTRGAILSIAFNQAEPAVDGNVMRVLSRVLKIDDDISLGKTRKKFEDITRELISESDPSSFNQAVMELGALVCTPKSPMCMFCPVQEYCSAYKEGVQEQLPVKAKKAKQRRKSYLAILIKNNQGQVVIEKRPDTGLLANLWQFPMAPVKDVMDAEQWLYKEYGLDVILQKKQGKLKHVFSHIIWELEIYDAVLEDSGVLDERLQLVEINQLNEYPFPVSHQKMMKYL
ncbi:MAG TPA: A/G-specific adenine glycosylase [Candidatus Avamphibacillus sp.]|nr:A/G-specific adenine glycosylase [Candidatus Avamphibacillus sp.]